ncbi:cation diffusion facilitator family transporter [Lacticaseibacillus casei]|uniref:Cation diffusion facilitator family transporter n=1 Tax=Lacticaseibacillus casei TaxID=1582 RepID=A0ABZ0BTW8_LACCA|nr:cation diffusion facilitator family transporter [Lacticaseibacillus casei]KAB1971036.1 cation transporter [Lacticaseibacillus casei]WNX23851.1 cation diffusion facilitator family transporter [Lacticaseibacillus casei]WNX26626.1 cation diffusion facilitator family transporter [Lacticaseibacillus casei]
MDAGRNILKDEQRRFARLKSAQHAAALNLFVYGGLTVAELWIAQLAHSRALAADGLNNLTGVASALILLWGLQISQQRPDSEHRFGHWRFQTIATLFSGLIMLVVGADVVLDGYHGLQAWAQGKVQVPGILAVYVSLAAGLAMGAISLMNHIRAKQLNSSVLRTASKDSFSDAATSTGTLLAILGAKAGWLWLDGGAALAVGILLLYAAWTILRDAIFELTDGFDTKKIAAYRQTITQVPGVLGVQSIEARYAGDAVLLTIGIRVDPKMTVADSYELGEQVERKLMDKYDILDADVKTYPADLPPNDAPQDPQN